MLREEYKDRLQERFQAPDNFRPLRLVTKDGRSLYGYGSRPNTKPTAHVLYVAGSSEFTEKTYELARDFNARSFGFWAFDRYGMGRSGRYLSNVFKQHAQDFSRDAADITAFAEQKITDDAPVFLLGHSTGGLLSLMAAHHAPDLFRGAFLTAPLCGIADKMIKGRETIFNYVSLPRFIRESYIPGGGDWALRAHRKNGPQDCDYSGDPYRMRLQDYWQAKDFDLRIGSVTMGWVQAACRAIAQVRDPDYLKEIETPVDIVTAGEEHKAGKVDNEAAKLVAERLPHATIRNISGARHEILMERDTIRNFTLTRAMAFMHRHAL